ncbi:hypothetical protein AAY473_016110 [Plecturocebus cupreus]
MTCVCWKKQGCETMVPPGPGPAGYRDCCRNRGKRDFHRAEKQLRNRTHRPKDKTSLFSGMLVSICQSAEWVQAGEKALLLHKHSSILRGLELLDTKAISGRREDHLRPEVQNQTGQHGETPSLLKTQKLAGHDGAHLECQLFRRLRQENRSNLGGQNEPMAAWGSIAIALQQGIHVGSCLILNPAVLALPGNKTQLSRQPSFLLV